MTFGEHLRDDLAVINQYSVNGLQFTSEQLRDFLKERSALERDYAHRLEQLTKRYQKQREKISSSLLADPPSLKSPERESSAPALESVDVDKVGTLFGAWDCILKQTEDMAKVRLGFADLILSAVTDPMKAMVHKKDEARKKHLAFAQKLLDERQKVYGEKDKAKEKYDQACDLVDAAKQRHEKAPDDKAQDKLKKQWQQEILEMNNIKNNYILSIAVANAAKKRYLYEDMPTLMNQLEQSNSNRIMTTQSLCKKLVELESDTLKQLQDHLSTMLQSIQNINPAFDNQLLCRYHAKEWTEPYDFAFEPTLLWKDNDALVTDEHARIYLINTQDKIMFKISELDGEIAARQKELDGLNTLKDAYTKNPALGDADEVNENMIETGRAMSLLNGVKSRYERSLAVITETVGTSSADQRHVFAKSSFTIPTTCDYCLDKIWGLAKQGFTCRECGYNCHSKCELKVPLNCSRTKGKKNPNPPVTIVSPPGSAMSPTTSNLSRQPSQLSHAPPSISINRQASKLSKEDDEWDTSSPTALTPTKPSSGNLLKKPSSTAIQPPRSSSLTKTSSKVVYTYDATGPDEVSIREGDNVTVLEGDDGSGWCKVQTTRGQTGLVPASYIASPSSTDAAMRMVSTKSTPSAGKRVRVVYDYDATSPDELTIRAGATVEILGEPDNGWITARVNGKEGLVPENYLEV